MKTKNVIFKQNFAQKLFVAFKIAFSFCFGLRGNLNFPDFLQKYFYNINYIGIRCCSCEQSSSETTRDRASVKADKD